LSNSCIAAALANPRLLFAWLPRCCSLLDQAWKFNAAVLVLPYRRCAAEVEELNHSVMAAAELLLQHAASMRSGIQDLAAAVGGITAEVQAAEQMVAH
jgi:hypothetical protein